MSKPLCDFYECDNPRTTEFLVCLNHAFGPYDTAKCRICGLDAGSVETDFVCSACRPRTIQQEWKRMRRIAPIDQIAQLFAKHGSLDEIEAKLALLEEFQDLGSLKSVTFRCGLGDIAIDSEQLDLD